MIEFLSELAPCIFHPTRRLGASVRAKAHQILLEAYEENPEVVQPQPQLLDWTISDPDYEHTVAQSLWEAIVPEAWTSSARRKFVCFDAQLPDRIVRRSLSRITADPSSDEWLFQREPTQNLIDYAKSNALSTPSLLRAALVLAMDMEGLTTVEAYIKELLVRWSPWLDTTDKVVTERNIVWVTSYYHQAVLSQALREEQFKGYRQLKNGLREHGEVIHPLDGRMEGWLPGVVQQDFFLALSWYELTQRGAEFSPGFVQADRLNRQPMFQNYPNPFEPMVEIWNLGYGVFMVTEQEVYVLASLR